MRKLLLALAIAVVLAAGCEGSTLDSSDPCDPNPCLNDGSCAEDGDGFECACATGFEGARCERAQDVCSAKPCMNGGTCLTAGDGFFCVCAAGFAGATCETNADDCNPNPCFNGGSCSDAVDGFACSCAAGFEGVQCESNVDDCPPNPCVHGVCIDQNEAFGCVCDPGYTGATCEVDIDDCNPNLCFNGGDCLDEVDSFTCMCPSGDWGVQCEVAMEQLAITTQLLPTAVTDNAYAVSLAHTGGSSMAEWSIVPGGTNDSWLSLDPATGVLSGTPLAANEGPVLVTIRIKEPNLPANFSEETFAFDVIPLPAPAYDTSFEGACPNGWVLTGDWECGVPVNVGPATAFTGTQCIATKIDANYNDFQSFASATATSPAIVLPAAPPMRVTFRIWIDTEGATYDGVNLRISNDGGNNFVLVNSVTPAYPLFVAGQPAWGAHQAGLGWQLYEADLAAYAGQTVHLRFAFRSDSSGTFPGIYIDDVHVGY